MSADGIRSCTHSDFDWQPLGIAVDYWYRSIPINDEVSLIHKWGRGDLDFISLLMRISCNTLQTANCTLCFHSAPNFGAAKNTYYLFLSYVASAHTSLIPPSPSVPSLANFSTMLYEYYLNPFYLTSLAGKNTETQQLSTCLVHSAPNYFAKCVLRSSPIEQFLLQLWSSASLLRSIFWDQHF